MSALAVEWGEGVVEVLPVWVSVFDQFDLPRAVPFFHAGFASFGAVAGSVDLIPDKVCDVVFGGKSGDGLLLMFPHAARKAVGLADVKRAVLSGCEHVNVKSHHELILHPFACGYGGGHENVCP